MKKQLLLCAAFLVVIQTYAQDMPARGDLDKPFTSLKEAFKRPDRVFVLDLSGMNLTKLPGKIRRFKNLKELDLSNNMLQEIPEEIEHFTHLKKLDISYNQLSALPVELKNLQFIDTLDLSDNRFTPVQIASWRKHLPHTFIVTISKARKAKIDRDEDDFKMLFEEETKEEE